MMHFPPVSDFPPIFEKFSKFYRFPKNFLIFIRRNFWWPFFFSFSFFWSSTTNFEFLPLFPCFSTYYFPLLWQIFPPVLHKFTCFLHTFYVYFVSPLLWPWCICASPNARTGRPWQHACLEPIRDPHSHILSYSRIRFRCKFLVGPTLSCQYSRQQ